ncbi:UNVERIFIED_CONTAM: hypothetical protein Sradi_3808200 [Sesamum radiatum]|uniref:Reverse transcriptase Ty1/copia-type domain-containing protein n=1 Tax=Sesamum radiatum TaxID=300843 RepID=A0AAW2Q0P0_SESRA
MYANSRDPLWPYASRKWNQEFTTKLEAFGFTNSKHDHCLFTKVTSLSFCVLLVYLDDVLFARPSEEVITEIKQYLDKLFTIIDLWTTKCFLGLKFVRSEEGLAVTQTKYIRDIVANAGLSNAKATTLHIVAYADGNLQLTAYCDAEWATWMDTKRSLTGHYIFLAASLISWKTKKQNNGIPVHYRS